MQAFKDVRHEGWSRDKPESILTLASSKALGLHPGIALGEGWSKRWDCHGYELGKRLWLSLLQAAFRLTLEIDRPVLACSLQWRKAMSDACLRT